MLLILLGIVRYHQYNAEINVSATFFGMILVVIFDCESPPGNGILIMGFWVIRSVGLY